MVLLTLTFKMKKCIRFKSKMIEKKKKQMY